MSHFDGQHCSHLEYEGQLPRHLRDFRGEQPNLRTQEMGHGRKNRGRFGEQLAGNDLLKQVEGGRRHVFRVMLLPGRVGEAFFQGL